MCVLKVKVISLPYISPGFVCFVLFYAKISGERLQDHWSSGLMKCFTPDMFTIMLLNILSMF